MASVADVLCRSAQWHLSTSLSDLCRHASIPTAWKTSTVIPIPKTNNPKQLNNFRPVAVKSLVMKTLEKLVKSLILPITECQLDPLQFAYRAGRGVEDVKLFILDKVYTHLHKPTAHTKILFADFSSAFNLMQPHILAHKLIYDFNLGNQHVAWIVDFFSCHPQSVFVNGKFSDMRLTHTDFRKHSQNPDQEVEIVTMYKYLGTVFDNKLRWDDNTEVIIKKCQQGLYFLRKLTNSLLIKKKFVQVLWRVCFALLFSASILT